VVEQTRGLIRHTASSLASTITRGIYGADAHAIKAAATSGDKSTAAAAGSWIDQVPHGVEILVAAAGNLVTFAKTAFDLQSEKAYVKSEFGVDENELIELNAEITRAEKLVERFFHSVASIEKLSTGLGQFYRMHSILRELYRKEDVINQKIKVLCSTHYVRIKSMGPVLEMKMIKLLEESLTDDQLREFHREASSRSYTISGGAAIGAFTTASLATSFPYIPYTLTQIAIGSGANGIRESIYTWRYDSSFKLRQDFTKKLSRALNSSSLYALRIDGLAKIQSDFISSKDAILRASRVWASKNGLPEGPIEAFVIIHSHFPLEFILCLLVSAMFAFYLRYMHSKSASMLDFAKKLTLHCLFFVFLIGFFDLARFCASRYESHIRSQASAEMMYNEKCSFNPEPSFFWNYLRLSSNGNLHEKCNAWKKQSESIFSFTSVLNEFSVHLITLSRDILFGFFKTSGFMGSITISTFFLLCLCATLGSKTLFLFVFLFYSAMLYFSLGDYSIWSILSNFK
jgi:hypothetical protein